MQKTMLWSDVLAALRDCAGERVVLRDGRDIEPVGAVRLRPGAKGAELCLFSDGGPLSRAELIGVLAQLSQSAGRRFASSARAKVNGSFLVVDGVEDVTADDVTQTIISTRRAKLGYNPANQTGHTTTLRSKRIKTG